MNGELGGCARVFVSPRMNRASDRFGHLGRVKKPASLICYPSGNLLGLRFLPTRDKGVVRGGVPRCADKSLVARGHELCQWNVPLGPGKFCENFLERFVTFVRGRLGSKLSV